MPYIRCGGCRKFLTPAEAATCAKCGGNYHRACIALSATGRLSPNWRRPECKKNLPTDNGTETPIRNKDVVQTKGDNFEEQTQDATHDILVELNSFKNELREEIKLMCSELQHIRSDITHLKNSIKSCNERLDDMDSRICLLESNNNRSSQEANAAQNLDEVVAQLNQELNDRDQEMLSNDIEISNLPETISENLFHTLQLMATKLGVTIEERDIVSTHRIGGRHINATNPAGSAESRPRQVTVRLARRHLRDQLLSSARVRRGATTADLGLTGTPVRFYVNERLSKANRLLFRESRKAAQGVGWKIAWTKQGRTFARKQHGDQVFMVRTENDIIRIFGKDKDN